MKSPSEDPDGAHAQSAATEARASQDRIIASEIDDEMKTSYLDYAMSVIIGRALPDVRDGLKPVHRRILFAMHEMGLAHNKPYKKSARIVGEVLGKYHPHGDVAVYDALARMVQDFSLRYTLIDGHGNFGSMDGDSPAAMRYTEARMSKISEALLADIDKETVDFAPNFDNSEKEPKVLPSKFPNMLVNGSNGIAVGMATNIPPHNLREIAKAVAALIDNPELGSAELMEHVRGPDFPTGGQILGHSGIRNYFLHGKGRIVVRAKIDQEIHKGRTRLIVTEIPYQVNKATLISDIAELVKNKIIEGVDDLRDESDRHGVRIVIELKSSANPEVLLNQLYHHSRLQDTFHVMMLAIADGTPRVLALKEFLQSHISHRQQVVRRRTAYELRTAEDRMHILEGLIIALDNLDQTVALIRKSKSPEEARKSLMETFALSEKQSQSILDMRLQRLTSLEQNKVRDEHKETVALIKRLKDILSDERKILSIIRGEILELGETFGDDRRTDILAVEESSADIDVEDLIEPEDCVITFTHTGYIKRTPLEHYREQRRGGKGIIAAQTKESDNIRELFIANTKDVLLAFSTTGKVHWLKTYKIPESSRQARGTSVANLLELDDAEKITTFIPVHDYSKGYLLLATRNGIVKKTELSAFSNPRKGGIIAFGIDKDDALVSALLTTGNDQVLIASARGLAVRFEENDIRPMGRQAGGVIGMRLRDDHVIGAVVAPENKALLTVTENGFGKRTSIEEYRTIKRGGLGIINIQTNERNGNVVAIRAVTPEEQVMIISQQGITLRTNVAGISEIGRNTQGVRLMKLEQGDKVVSMANLIDLENGNASSTLPPSRDPPTLPDEQKKALTNAATDTAPAPTQEKMSSDPFSPEPADDQEETDHNDELPYV